MQAKPQGNQRQQRAGFHETPRCPRKGRSGVQGPRFPPGVSDSERKLRLHSRETATAPGDKTGPRGAPRRSERRAVLARQAGVREKSAERQTRPRDRSRPRAGGDPVDVGSLHTCAGPRLTRSAPLPTGAASALPPRRRPGPAQRSRPGPGFPEGRRLSRWLRRETATDGPRRRGSQRRRSGTGRPPRRP